MAIIYDPARLTYLQALRNLQARGVLDYHSFSNDWVVKFWRDDRVRFMLSRVPDANSQVAGEIAMDKVGTYLLLADAHLPAVPHFLLSTLAEPEIDRRLLQELLTTHGPLVIKPTLGSMGRDMARCDDIDSIEHHIASHHNASWSASPYLDIASETRLIVYGGEVALAYEKINPPFINGMKMFNLNRGATARDIDRAIVSPPIAELAIRAMRTIGLTLGAVDIVTTADGNTSVLEINSRFSIEHYAALHPDYAQKAIAFYEMLFQSVLDSKQQPA